MESKMQRFLTLLATSTLLIVAGQTTDKYTDENRPYEFGFNIEGQQHRHEKKDESGIITGEFGFITADGIYHVTVYATDENGDFKIISMKNIRVAPSPYGNPGVSISTVAPAGRALLASSTPPPLSTSPPVSSVKNIFKGHSGCSSCLIPTTTQAPSRPISPESTFPPSGGSSTGPTQQAKPVTGLRLPTVSGPAVTRNSGFSQTPGSNDQKPITNVGNITPDTKPPSELLPPYTSDQQPNVPGSLATPVSSTFKPQKPVQNVPFSSPPSIPISNPAQTPLSLPRGNIPATGIFIGTPVGQNPIIPGSQFPKVSIPSSSPPGSQRSQFPGVNTVSKSPAGIPGSQFPNVNTPSLTPPGIPRTLFPNTNTAADIPGTQIPNVRTPGSSPLQREATPEDRIPLDQNYKIPGGATPQVPRFDTAVPNQGNVPPGGNFFQPPSGISRASPIRPTPSPIGVERDGLPPGVSMSDVMNLLYMFNYTVGFHGHHEAGYTNGDKEGGYFVNGRDGVSRRVTYIANEFGYQPNITLLDLGQNSVDTPKEETEKEFGLKGYEFKWFPS